MMTTWNHKMHASFSCNQIHTFTLVTDNASDSKFPDGDKSMDICIGTEISKLKGNSIFRPIQGPNFVENALEGDSKVNVTG